MDEFEIGDLVWAKMKGFSPWPGRVTVPKTFLKKPNLKTEVQCIFFFGTHNYAFIEKANIKPYLDFKNKFEKSCKSQSFRDAIEDIEDAIRKMGEDASYDPEADIKPPGMSTDEESAAEMEEEIIADPEEEEPKMKKRKRSSVAKTKAKLSTPIASPTVEKNGPTAKDASLTKVETEVKEAENKQKREATPYVLGFLGVGRMGRNIITNLVTSGHKVNVWNRTISKADILRAELDAKYPGLVQLYSTPLEVANNSDIIFSCVTDYASVKNIWYGENGLNEVETFAAKGYVELSNIGTENSLETYKIITSKEGRYIEAQLQGGVSEAEEGKLVILVAGDEKLYDDCNSSFEAIGKTIFYLGKVGSASKMNLILQVMRGVAMVGLQESFALAGKCGLTLKDVLEIFSITSMNSPFLQLTASNIVADDVELEHTMKNIRSDIKMALDFSDVLKQPLVMASAANESILKQLNA